MPKSDTWPGGVAMETLNNIDSAGSCDSVVSMNSGSSDDSLEHLSPEERACLMFLEETIESLEMEEDSGLSNDEPELGKVAHLSSAMGQTRPEDVSNFHHDESGTDQKSFLSCRVPTPLLLANGCASILPKHPGDATEPEPPTGTTEPKTLEVPNEAKPPEVATELVVPGDGTEPTAPSSATVESKTSELANDFKTPEPAAEPKASEFSPDTKASTSAQAEVMVSTIKGVDVDSKPDQAHTRVLSDLNLGLILPPSDFRDKPQPEPVEENEPPAFAGPRGPLTHNDLEHLRKKASMKGASPGSPVTQEAPSKPFLDAPPSPSEAPPSPISDEPRTPPAVAPKPKRLPSNIILKSHKRAGSDGYPNPTVPSASDWVQSDPQRVRMEALRKLGLLKSEDGDSNPAQSPSFSSKFRRSWASPPSPSPSSPATPHTLTTDATPPASTPVPAPATTPAQATSQAQASVPAPAPASLLSDAAKTLPSITEQSPSKESQEHRDNAMAPSDGHCTPPMAPKLLPSTKTKGVKSATLERSGLGLGSYIASQVASSSDSNQGSSPELSPCHLRKSRPRPASLGSGKDFEVVQGEASQCQPEMRRSLPAPSGDDQKLPRSHGVSVLFCPNDKSVEDRKEALKKLGLLRD